MEEIIKVLDKITWELFEKNPKLEALTTEWGITPVKLEYRAAYGFVSIDFMGLEIWNSEDDERYWVEEENDYEDWDTYLTRKIKEILDSGGFNITL